MSNPIILQEQFVGTIKLFLGQMRHWAIFVRVERHPEKSRPRELASLFLNPNFRILFIANLKNCKTWQGILSVYLQGAWFQEDFMFMWEICLGSSCKSIQIFLVVTDGKDGMNKQCWSDKLFARDALLHSNWLLLSLSQLQSFSQSWNW
jgi:hypothetical protein